MGYETIYCVRAYRRQGRSLEGELVGSFMRRADAMAAAVTCPRSAGYVVYSVEVDAVAREVGRIRVLARYGEAPCETVG